MQKKKVTRTIIYNVAIGDIDGKDVFVTARNWWVPVVTKTRAAVLPGEHTLHIKYAVAVWQSLGCELKVEAESGKTYRVKAKSYATVQTTLISIL